MKYFWKIQTERQKCQTCEARYVCGGECMVVSYYKDKKLDSVDEVMCKLKRHLFELAIKFKFELILHDEELFNVVFAGCLVKANRFQEDKELLSTLQKLNGKYTFIELKRIKDNFPEEYDEIKKSSFL